MKTIDLAWKVIEHWTRVDYGGDKNKAANDLCDPGMRDAPSSLDDCAVRIADCIDDNYLIQYSNDMLVLSSEIELAGY